MEITRRAPTLAPSTDRTAQAEQLRETAATEQNAPPAEVRRTGTQSTPAPLGPPSAPSVTLQESGQSGATAFANVLDGLGSQELDPDILMARFLKLQALDGSRDTDDSASAGDGHSQLNQLAIEISRSVGKLVKYNPKIDMGYLMYLQELADTALEQGIGRESKRQDKAVEKVLEGQMNGDEDRSVDEKKRERKLRKLGPDGTPITDTTVPDDIAVTSTTDPSAPARGLDALASMALDASNDGIAPGPPRSVHLAAEARRENVARALRDMADGLDATNAGRLATLRS